MSKKSTSQKRQVEGRRTHGEMRGRVQLSGSRQSQRMRAARVEKSGLPWHIGAPIIMLMAISVVASVWFAWKIEKGLGELSRTRQESIEENALNIELIARRDSLLAKDSIVKKAAVLGLFPATDKQIRKP